MDTKRGRKKKDCKSVSSSLNAECSSVFKCVGDGKNETSNTEEKIPAKFQRDRWVYYVAGNVKSPFSFKNIWRGEIFPAGNEVNKLIQ